MEVITVKKKNETWLDVECEASIERELSEHFCFYVPGYKFMPAYRNKIWDGKIRLYDLRKKQLYVGLFDYLCDFASIRDYSVVSEGSKYYGTPGEVLEPLIEGLLSDITLTVNGSLVTPRPYQIEGLSHTLSKQKSLLLSPTGSGKSMMIYLAMRYYLKHNDGKVLIIVPTTSLVAQMYNDFLDYSALDDDWEASERCHQIMSGREKFGVKQRVIISTWQSIYKLQPSWFQDYGMVIGDEAHNFKAKSLTTIMEKCTNAKYRIGTTGTLDGTQTHQLVLEGLFGPVYRVTTTKELIDAGTLEQLDISVLLLKYKDEICKEVSRFKYQEELDFIVRYNSRNNFISNLAVDQEGNTLILFQFVEKHGKPLHDLLKTKVDKDRKLFYVSGETDVDDRESIRAITEKESNAIIVASIGTFSTGINIKRLNNLIFASPSKSQIRVLQSIGRGLRKSDRKTQVFDIADDLHWKSKKNYTLNHAADRIKLYAKEKFNYKLHEVKIG